jgi:uncharacterized membrane protein YdjX (TVP38/TMEM64 family)
VEKVGRQTGARVRSEWVRLTVLIAVVATVVVVFAVEGVPSFEDVRSTVDGAGAWAPVLFVVLFALATLAVLPVSLFSLSAGVLFGPVEGLGLVWLGAMAGSLACFGLGRVLSRPALLRLAGSDRGGPALARLELFLARRGLVAVLSMRLVPVVPFGPSSYVAGATALQVRDFAVGTGIGILPGVVVFTVLGGSVGDPTSPAFLGAVAAFLLLLAVSGVLARRSRRTGELPGEDL